ncbi:hypothetical protein [Phyllobacterium salinisoli]|uniref:hypothetical protein n=1 Tax=Phyllobacterium salinisoli TaxID=1899321 RepID=UPI001FDFA66A|nr:hypothetical protein [Phyllobacterium salinisoli]
MFDLVVIDLGLSEFPLREGPSYMEWFAPVIPLQPWDSLDQLNGYFRTSAYRRNAMYVTLLGQKLEGDFDLSQYHPPDTVLWNTDLHEHERGYLPYGGYGPEASYVALDRVHLTGPILPQRDLEQYLLEPRLRPVPNTLNAATITRRQPLMTRVTPKATPSNDERLNRLAKLERLRALGIDPYPAKSHRTSSCAQVRARFDGLAAGEATSEIVSVAGRVTAIRNSGMFIDVFAQPINCSSSPP